MKSPEAPYEVASSPLALPVEDKLYYQGKCYARPNLSSREIASEIAHIRRNLGVCDHSCKGVVRWWHQLGKKPGHEGIK